MHSGRMSFLMSRPSLLIAIIPILSLLISNIALYFNTMQIASLPPKDLHLGLEGQNPILWSISASSFNLT